MAEAEFKPVKPCRKCGATDKTKRGECKPCAKASTLKYYEKNKSKFILNSAKYYAANKDRLLAGMKEYRKKYPEKAAASCASWQARNPDAIKIIASNRRSRILDSGGVLSKGLVEKLMVLQKGKCPCCREPLGEDRHLDHIQPLARGGSNTDDNMQLLHQRCNNQKWAKHPIDFMQERGFLL